MVKDSPFTYNTRATPRDPREYVTKEFWHDFHISEPKFEWYGSILDYMFILSEFLDMNSIILNLGCGTSSLEFELATVGFPNVHSIDIDKSVIDRKNRSNKIYPNLRYDCASVEDIPAPDNFYDAIVDKGTMDALLPTPDMAPSEQKLCDNMLDECFRVLKPMGHYVIITLAQQQVIEKLWDYTQSHRNVIVRVTVNEVLHNNSFFPAVVFDMVKLKNDLPGPMQWRLVETRNAKGVPRSFEQIREFLISQYQFAHFGNMCRKRLEHIPSITVSVHDPEGKESDVRVTVVDSRTSRIIVSHAFVIVPPDGEDHFYNRSVEHYKDIPGRLKADRVIMCEFGFTHDEHSRVVINEIHKRFVSRDSDGITTICKMIPELPSVQIHEGVGEVVGKYAVTQCGIADIVYRRLFFESSPTIIQSECIIDEGGKVRDVSSPERICVGYQMAMAGSFELVPGGFFDLHKKVWRAAVLGVGGGGLVTFLYHALPKSVITCVEIEPALYKVATEYFGMPEDEKRIKMLTRDAIEWMVDPESGVHDLIFVDISGPNRKMEKNDKIIGPPAEFVTKAMIAQYKNRLSPRGCIVLNIIATKYDICRSIMTLMAPHFFYVFETSVSEGASNNNYIIFASNEKPKRCPSRMEKQIPDFFRSLYKHGKQYNRFEFIVPPKKEERKKKPKGEFKFRKEPSLHTDSTQSSLDSTQSDCSDIELRENEASVPEPIAVTVEPKKVVRSYADVARRASN